METTTGYRMEWCHENFWDSMTFANSLRLLGLAVTIILGLLVFLMVINVRSNAKDVGHCLKKDIDVKIDQDTAGMGITSGLMGLFLSGYIVYVVLNPSKNLYLLAFLLVAILLAFHLISIGLLGRDMDDYDNDYDYRFCDTDTTPEPWVVTLVLLIANFFCWCINGVVLSFYFYAFIQESEPAQIPLARAGKDGYAQVDRNSEEL